MSDTQPQEASKIVLSAIDSSNIDSFGYSETINLLAVQFKTGDLYLYAGVPKQIYQGMVTADSKGSYLNKVVKPHYLCAKVE